MNQWEAVLLALENQYKDPSGKGPRAEDGNPAYVGKNASLNHFYPIPGLFGMYSPKNDKIAFNSDLNKYPYVRANTLAHEGQHRQYERTMNNQNPRLTRDQYLETLAGYYYDPRTGSKKKMHAPGAIGYASRDKQGNLNFPSMIHERNKDNPLLSSDYSTGDNGFLANWGGLEGMLPPGRRLEENPVFTEQFPTKNKRDWYYRNAFPETNWLKESDYPTKSNSKLKEQDTSRYPKTNVSNKPLLKGLLEVMGF